jgi:predicted metalloprotease with PDZ domain
LGIAGITEADIFQAILELPELPDQPKLATRQALLDWVHTATELPLTKLLNEAGVQVQRVPASLAQQLGLVLGADHTTIRIKHVLHGSAAHHAGFAAGDEWLTIEVQGQAWRLQNVDELLLYASAGEPVLAGVARDRRMHALSLSLPPIPPSNNDIKLVIEDAKKVSLWLGI